ncbi:hypothetical protein M595_1272 [Lyngbya aestuarii BL J]|uniref:Uncharacterized protein n=1 Tax=Lyngbya aestuarii BL J TaxID=1348334 RepID=U7QNR5_9CYAN|nr:hypothetical protein M595_1272 [Lyngbya aestuarii BL J]
MTRRLRFGNPKARVKVLRAAIASDFTVKTPVQKNDKFS